MVTEMTDQLDNRCAILRPNPADNEEIRRTRDTKEVRAGKRKGSRDGTLLHRRLETGKRQQLVTGRR
jgi:hypothetical protein